MLLNNQGLWLAQDHGEELRRHAEVHRLLKLNRPARQNWLDRLSVRLGLLLVAAGTRLQARQASGTLSASGHSF